MSSTTRAQRLTLLRNRYELLSRSISVIPSLEGTRERWRAMYEGRLHVLKMTSAALTQIPARSSGQIRTWLKAVRDQLAALQQADLALIAQCEWPVERAPREVLQAHGSVPTRAAVLRDVEALLPRKWRTQPGSYKASPLSLAKIRWTEEHGACVYCQLPAFFRLPDEMASLVLCQEHLAPFVTPASLRAVIKRLDARLAHRFDLRCAMSLPTAVVENDVAELYRYYTLRWLTAAQRTEDAIAYQSQRDLRWEEGIGLRIEVQVEGKTVQEGTYLSLSVSPTLHHRLVLLDLIIALEQAEWIEEVSPHPGQEEGRVVAA